MKNNATFRKKSSSMIDYGRAETPVPTLHDCPSKVGTGVSARPQWCTLTLLACTLFCMESTTLAHESHDHDAEPNRIEMRDVVSGAGYIVGVFGLIALWKNRNRKDNT